MTAVRTTNTKCRQLVERQRPFNGCNLFAECIDRVPEDDYPGAATYVVYSYGHHWPLYAVIGGKWFGNSDKYSPTTSKQASQARPYHEDITYVTKKRLDQLIERGLRALTEAHPDE